LRRIALAEERLDRHTERAPGYLELVGPTLH